ncbi:PfkB domain protein [Desulfovibrionales bacterium]
MRLYVSGSLAYDHIMTFPGKFADHIMPDKIHILNVCFLVDEFVERFGGTAGNIAYTLRLLGERPLILACSGHDFGPYEKYLRALNLPLEGIRHIDEEYTAGAYITTDQADNQITGFNPGAMRHPSRFHIDHSLNGGALAIVAPGNIEDMVEYPRIYRQLNLPYIFDPGQQTTALSASQLVEAFVGAKLLVTNDYELELIIQKTGLTVSDLLEYTETAVTTLGEQGVRIREAGRTIEIPAARTAAVVDPTGIGDAFRAGLMKGLILGKSLFEAARMGAVAASFCVEKAGTQEHVFDDAAFIARYRESYGEST